MLRAGNLGESGELGLTADNAILPIAYYLYRTERKESFLTGGKYESDRKSIRGWLTRSLLKSGVWGSGLDGLLTRLRKVIHESETYEFPATRIGEEMARRGHELVFNDEEIEELADTEYCNPRAFAILSLLFPFVETEKLFHIDHIFPVARFNRPKLRDDEKVPEEKIEEFLDRVNRLGNLQLLPGPVNMEKGAAMPAHWLAQKYTCQRDRKQICDDHLLGSVPEKMSEFGQFYDARRKRLVGRIKILLGRPKL